MDPASLNSPSYIYNYQWNHYHWRRNYNGIFSAHMLFNQPTDQNILFAISHGENKNEKQGTYFYQNTVNPNKAIDPNNGNTYSGQQGNTYVEDYDAYHAFVNGNWIPYDAAHNWGATYLNDLGPIVWPSAGYTDSNGINTSNGVKQPSSIVYGNYLYIYVMDNSFDGTGGVKLIRCLKDSLLSPAAYKTWSASAGWIPSLPAGFSSDQIASFFTVRGPQNTAVLPDSYSTIRFAVAQMSDSADFIGVEQYIDNSNNHALVALRYSSDLINWTDRTVILNENNGWDQISMHYPIFLSKDGMTNTAIDRNDFYVIGSTTPVNTIKKLHFVNTSIPAPVGLSVSKRTANDSAVSLSPEEPVRLSPNPSQGILSLFISIAKSGRYKAVIYNAAGLAVQELDLGLLGQGPYRKDINVGQLPSGTYFLNTIKDGMKLATYSFVK